MGLLIDTLLIVFAKNPNWGKVKTRLAEKIGSEAALDVYKQLLEITECLLQHFNAKVYLAEKGELWQARKPNVQIGKDLGAKMHNAFDIELKNAKKVVLIGSDCPEISTEIIQMAFDKLNHVDVVIGPALDGGYYLIGLKRPTKEIFVGIDWSTEVVFKQTIKKINELSLKVAILPHLRDLDDLLDLNYFIQKGFVSFDSSKSSLM